MDEIEFRMAFGNLNVLTDSVSDHNVRNALKVACAVALEVNGHKTKAAINYLLQLVWDVHDEQRSHINWSKPEAEQPTDG